MVFDFLSVETEIHVDAVLFIQGDRGGKRERNPLVCGPEQRVGGYLILRYAVCIELAEALDLRTLLIFARIQKVRGYPAALQFERAELQNAALRKKADKFLLISHFLLLYAWHSTLFL